MKEIVLTPDILGYIGKLPLTNSFFVSLLVSFILVIVSVIATRRMKLIPSGLQNLMEAVVEYGYNFTEDLAHDKTKMFFPICMTFFLFIILANWAGLLPGFGTIGFYKLEHGQSIFIPLLKSVNSDLNVTLALAIVSAVTTHIFAIKNLGIKKYLGKWVSKNPIFMFVGVLEIVSEFTKIISLSFRLFGNIFAGEIVLATIAGMFAFILPLPFYFLEIIVGFVQATVFMLLTLTFMVLLSQETEHN